MKLIKKMSCMFLALLMVITVLAVPTPAAAAERGGVPTKVRIYPGSYTAADMSGTDILKKE